MPNSGAKSLMKDTTLSEDGRGAARHGRGTAWTRLGICELGLTANRTGIIDVKKFNERKKKRKRKKRQRVIHRIDISLQQVKQWLLTAKGILSTVLRLG
jgi:hypothetical protein